MGPERTTVRTQPMETTFNEDRSQGGTNKSNYHIRLYKDSDYDAVRAIFLHGMTEHYFVAFLHTLSLHRIWIFLLAVFLLSLMTTDSSIVSLIAVAMVIVCLLLINRNVFVSYAWSCLASDMLDIQKSYLQRDGCCFWVAELAGEIGGIVAATPYAHAVGQNWVHLKRLSVSKEHRRKGIAKALCRTVIDYAQAGSYQAVILETSMFQLGSLHLYTKLGFQITGTYYPDYPFTKLIDFVEMYFRYDLSKQQQTVPGSLQTCQLFHSETTRSGRKSLQSDGNSWWSAGSPKRGSPVEDFPSIAVLIKTQNLTGVIIPLQFKNV